MTTNESEGVVNRLACTVIVGALAVAGPAMADDYYSNSNSILDWTGFYAGVVGGYGGGHGITDTVGVSTAVPLNGAIAGVTGGFNKQFDRLVLGVEGDIAWSGQSGSATCVLDPQFQCHADVDWIGSLRGRLGYAANRTLVFATAGAAIAHGNSYITSATVNFSGSMTGSYADSYVGWTAGGGIEYAFNERMSLKAEYAYADYGTRTAPAGTIAGPATSIHVTSHYGKAGLNVHF